MKILHNRVDELRKLVILFIFACCASFVFAANPPRVKKTMPFTKGLNLSLWLEVRNNICWLSELFDRQDFEDIKSLGVEIVRIPIWFEEFSSGEPDYIVEDWLWEKIDNAVEWCSELEMYMIIDFHNDCGGNTKTRPDIEKVLLKIWPQIAERYKDSGKYVLYEIMNEPHMKSGNIASDVSKWGKIQGNVLKKIREIDKTHTVIVGAEDWDSVTQLLKLPDYKDDNIILNFHDYSPMLFTHQGASWAGLENVRHIPFPYSKEKMPKKPKNQEKQGWIDSMFENYKTEGSEAYLVKPLDEAVKFANKRGVALMCNEWGVVMDYADNADRCNWYRLKAKWMDERNISRISWDYRDKNGVFTNDSFFSTEARFPEDLNTDLLKAMGLNVPSLAPRSRPSWFKNAQKTGDYTIYKNGFAKGILPGSWNITEFRINKKDSGAEPAYINVPKGTAYASVQCMFDEECDFSSLVKNGKTLEFEARSDQKNLSLAVYFVNPEKAGAGKANYPWRCQTTINDSKVPADGKWHKARIPLKDFYDAGAWSDSEQKYYSGEGLFSWSKVNELRFDFGEKGIQNGVSIRNIVIK